MSSDSGEVIPFPISAEQAALTSQFNEIARLSEAIALADEESSEQAISDEDLIYDILHEIFVTNAVEHGFSQLPYRLGAQHESEHVRARVAGNIAYAVRHDPTLCVELMGTFFGDPSHTVRLSLMESVEHILTDIALEDETYAQIFNAFLAGAWYMSSQLGDLQHSIDDHPSNS